MMNNSFRRRSPVGRYRDRSSSRERPRTRTYSDDDRHSESYHSDYSDDFEPTTRSRQRTPTRRRRKPTNGYSSNHYSSISDLHSSSSKKTTQSVGRRTYVKQKRTTRWRSNHSDRGGRTSYRSDPVTSRLLSAKQRRINDVQNELSEAQQRLEDVTKENKVLKTVQYRQDKALRRFEDVENDLPRLISQNFEDQKVLKARLSKARNGEKKLEEKLRENNDEMQKMEKTLRKLKKVVYDKNLGERSELARQLTNTENDLGLAERKIKELEKKLELMTSSYTRQIRSERQKHKETKDKLDTLVEEHQTVIAKLKEKERAIGVSNIYSLRHNDPPSVHSTPRKLKDAPISTKPSKVKKEDKNRKAEMAAIEFEDRTRNKQIKSYEMERNLPSPGPPSPAPFARSPINRGAKTNVDTTGLHSTTKPVAKERDAVFLTSTFHAESPLSNQPVAKDSIESGKNDRERDDDGDHDTSSSSIPSKLTFETTPNEDTLLDTTHRQKIDEEALNRKRLEEEKEELRKKQKLQEEKEKLAEQQKKKAALLAKMRDIEYDEESPRSPPGSMPIVSLADSSKPPHPIETKKSKHSTDKEIGQKSKAERVRSLLSNDIDPIVENLHLGIPTTVKRSNENSESEISFGGYAPSVGGAEHEHKSRAVNKKSVILSPESDNDEPLFDLNSGSKTKNSDLLNQLFGDQSKSEKSTTDQKVGQSTTPRAKPVHSGYPWEKNVVTSSQVNGAANPHFKVKTGFQVKASTPIQDDDIEELSL